MDIVPDCFRTIAKQEASMAVDIFGVQHYLHRANDFIDQGEPHSLRHACLELRLAVETIVYARLAQVGEKLPRQVFKTWQPPQAMKRLLAFEPRADQPVSIRVCSPLEDGSPSGEWRDLGHAKMFSANRLSKIYNKLGSFLHATSLEQQGDPPKIEVSSVRELFVEIQHVADSQVIMSMNAFTVFKCLTCDSDIYLSEAQIESSAPVECYQDKCKARHLVSKMPEEKLLIERDWEFCFPCKACGEDVGINDIEHEAIVICEHCGHSHQIGWTYSSHVPL